MDRFLKPGCWHLFWLHFIVCVWVFLFVLLVEWVRSIIVNAINYHPRPLLRSPACAMESFQPFSPFSPTFVCQGDARWLKSALNFCFHEPGWRFHNDIFEILRFSFYSRRTSKYKGQTFSRRTIGFSTVSLIRFHFCQWDVFYCLLWQHFRILLNAFSLIFSHILFL